MSADLPAMTGNSLLLFRSFHQRLGIQLGNIYDLPVIRMVAHQKRLGNVVAHRQHHALLLRLVQKPPGLGGLGRDIQVEYADDAPVVDHDVLADMQKAHHSTFPSRT